MPLTDHSVERYTVRFQDCNPCGHIHLHRLLDYAQDCDDRNCGLFGLKSDMLLKRGICWILISHATHFTGPFPVAEDTLIVDSWTRGTKGIRLYRDNRYYRNVVDDEHLFGTASSQWILSELDTHRPLRPSDVTDVDDYNRRSDPTVGNMARIPRLKPFADDDDRAMLDMEVQLGNLDTNTHLHSMHYVRAAVDAAGKHLAIDPWEEELIPVRFHIQFVSEMNYLDRMRVYLRPDGEDRVLLEGRHIDTGDTAFLSTLEYAVVPRSIEPTY
ncbi:MAG: acyl-ACP thioesterase domain-containing protein [Saccharofermentanales bacterium]|jgi:medium-chain acyl-[acyl-carrier-protein] hydrolase